MGSVGERLGSPWGALGSVWGALGERWGALGEPVLEQGGVVLNRNEKILVNYFEKLIAFSGLRIFFRIKFFSNGNMF